LILYHFSCRQIRYYCYNGGQEDLHF